MILGCAFLVGGWKTRLAGRTVMLLREGGANRTLKLCGVSTHSPRLCNMLGKAFLLGLLLPTGRPPEVATVPEVIKGLPDCTFKTCFLQLSLRPLLLGH